MIWALPLTTTDFSTNSLFAITIIFRILSFIKFGKVASPPFIVYYTPKKVIITLYFNRYRGKPAIAKFD